MMELGQVSDGGGMAVGEGEHLGGGRIRLDERFADHTYVGGACGVVGRGKDGAIEDAGLELFERERGFRGCIRGLGWGGCMEGGPCSGGGPAALPGRVKLCEFALGVPHSCCVGVGGSKEGGVLACVFRGMACGKFETDSPGECTVAVLVFLWKTRGFM